MNIKKIILYNFIKKKIPTSLKKILRPVKNFSIPDINKRELFTFLFKYSPYLLNKLLFKISSSINSFLIIDIKLNSLF